MKKTTKIIVIAIILAMLLIGIGYAAIQNVTLNISGTAQANPSQSSFKVMFTDVQGVSDEEFVSAGITDETNATINVTGLTLKGQTVTATYIVKNVSESLSADLSVDMTNENAEYFVTSSRLEKTSLTSGEETTVTVTIKLIKTPLEESVTSNINVTLTAMPVQPGQEGTSANISNFSHTSETLESVTTSNIGDYIDLGNNVIKTENTTDDWRILYKDEEEGFVYAILASYLPANQVPEGTTLKTYENDEDDATTEENYPYSVWSNIDSDDLVNGLLNDNAWNASGLSNGIYGATVIGTPTENMIMKSYNAKNGTNLSLSDFTINGFDKTIESNDIYIPGAALNCWGCYVADIKTDTSDDLIWIITAEGKSGGDVYNGKTDGIRPVVAIPVETLCSYSNGTWIINEL